MAAHNVQCWGTYLCGAGMPAGKCFILRHSTLALCNLHGELSLLAACSASVGGFEHMQSVGQIGSREIVHQNCEWQGLTNHRFI